MGKTYSEYSEINSRKRKEGKKLGKRSRTERKRGRNTKVIMKPLQDRENRRIIIRNKEGTSPEISPALKRRPAERKNENKTKLTPSK
jgi:hypothetical protein